MTEEQVSDDLDDPEDGRANSMPLMPVNWPYATLPSPLLLQLLVLSVI